MIKLVKAALLGSCLTAVAGSFAAAEEGNPVRIGYSMSLTGIFAAAAPSQVNAYELWAAEVNARGGLDVQGEKRPVEFVSYDDQSNPGNVVRIYERLITEDKVDLLAAPWGTPMHLAMTPVLKRFKFPMVGNTATSLQLREIDPGYIWFPSASMPDRQAAATAEMMKAKGVTKVAIMANVSPLSQEIRGALVESLKAQGIELVMSENYPADIKDMTTMIAQANASGADAVVALSYPADTFLFTAQAKELGVKAPFVMTLIGTTFDSYLKAMAGTSENVVTMGHWSHKQAAWPKAKVFYDNYLAKYNEAPDALDSALAYVSMEILEQAVAKAGLDHEALRAEIASATFDTINGPIKFEGVENTLTPTSMSQIQNGVIELVWPAETATAEYQPKTSW